MQIQKQDSKKPNALTKIDKSISNNTYDGEEKIK